MPSLIVSIPLVVLDSINKSLVLSGHLDMLPILRDTWLILDMLAIYRVDNRKIKKLIVLTIGFKQYKLTFGLFVQLTKPPV